MLTEFVLIFFNKADVRKTLNVIIPVYVNNIIIKLLHHNGRLLYARENAALQLKSRIDLKVDKRTKKVFEHLRTPQWQDLVLLTVRLWVRCPCP